MPFLHLYEKKFVENLLINNGNKLKSMEDQNNPLYQLLKICKKIDSNNHLLSNLIAACAKLIQLNNEEIRCDTFIRPTKKTFTYTVLFDKDLNDFKLFMGTINELNVLWNRWEHSGLTLSDLMIWRGHSSEERIIFDEIWNRVRQHFNKRQSIETVFQEAERKFIEKELLIEAMRITLNLYCDKASDRSSAIKSLQYMSEELKDKPIRSVQTPGDLQMIEAIALKLNPFFKSKVWVSYYNRNNSVKEVEEKNKPRKFRKSKMKDFRMNFRAKRTKIQFIIEIIVIYPSF
jgi:hypothetical protein